MYVFSFRYVKMHAGYQKAKSNNPLHKPISPAILISFVINGANQWAAI